MKQGEPGSPAPTALPWPHEDVDGAKAFAVAGVPAMFPGAKTSAATKPHIAAAARPCPSTTIPTVIACRTMRTDTPGLQEHSKKSARILPGPPPTVKSPDALWDR
ncbi:hypothetical protein MPRS_05890 [Mycobacterium paraseoulense]|nr:hypothetical protein MPRS_05890 [Mycobacterium paraseoulense]